MSDAKWSMLLPDARGQLDETLQQLPDEVFSLLVRQVALCVETLCGVADSSPPAD